MKQHNIEEKKILGVIGFKVAIIFIVGLTFLFLNACSTTGNSNKSIDKGASAKKVSQTQTTNNADIQSAEGSSGQNNLSATDKGINVTITSVNFDSNIDGNALKLTFKVRGDKLPVLNLDSKAENRATSYFEYFISDDPTVKQQMWITRTLQFKKGSNNTYNGEIVLNCRYNNLPENYPFKIHFLYMASKQGNWSFEIPLKGEPNKPIKLNGTSETTDHKYKVVLDDMLKGTASTTINFHTIRPNMKHGQLNLKIVDDQGKELHYHNGDDLKVNNVNGTLHEKTRMEFDAIPPNAKYLLVYPEVDVYGQVIKTFKKLPAIKVNLK